MIYVPDTNYSCYVVRSENVIRAYEEVPRVNSTIRYRDYYYTSNYLFNDGVQQFSQYTTNLPVCLDNSLITDSPYYRTDFDSILIIFMIMSIFCFYIPLRVFMRFFRRFN